MCRAAARYGGAETLSARVLAVSLASSATGMLPPFVVGGLAIEMQADLGFSARGLGIAVSAFFLTAGLVGFQSGKLVERWGWQSSMRLAAAGTLTTLVGIAAFATSWTALVVLMVFGGVWHAAAMPASNAALSANPPWPHRQAFTFGLRQGAVPATIMFAGVGASTISIALGWRWVYVAALVFPVAALLLVPRRPVVPTYAGAALREPTCGRSRRMVAVAVAGGCATAAVSALGAFSMLWYVHEGLTAEVAGLLLAAVSASAIVARVGIGWWGDRVGMPSFRIVSWMLIAGSAGYVALALGGTTAVVLGSFVAFAAGWGWPGLFHHGVVSANRGNPARATGIAQAGLSTGAAFGPLAFGVAAEQSTLAASWVLTGGVSAASGLLILMCLRGAE